MSIDTEVGTLILTRRLEQSIMLADGLIEVTVTEIQGGRVKLMVRAPRDIKILRGEVFERERQAS